MNYFGLYGYRVNIAQSSEWNSYTWIAVVLLSLICSKHADCLGMAMILHLSNTVQFPYSQ